MIVDETLIPWTDFVEKSVSVSVCVMTCVSMRS